MRREHTTSRKAQRLNLWHCYQSAAFSVSAAEKRAAREKRSKDFLDKVESGIIGALMAFSKARRHQAR